MLNKITVKPPAKTQGIKLDDAVRARLKRLGAQRGRSPHWLMRTAIESYLEREEQYEREKQEDEQRWQNYQLTGKAVAHDKVDAWMAKLIAGKKAKCPE